MVGRGVAVQVLVVGPAPRTTTPPPRVSSSAFGSAIGSSSVNVADVAPETVAPEAVTRT